MLQNRSWKVGLARLVAIILVSIMFTGASAVLGQEEPTPTTLYLPFMGQQSQPEPTAAQPQHENDDYALAEAARQRNEPRFVAPEIGTRATGSPSQVGQWSGVTTWPFAFASGANLPDGRIIAWGGNNPRSFNGGNFTYSAVWDPQTGTMTSRNHGDHSMFCAIPTMMEDGRVFVNGGDANTNKTSIFDYRTNQWSRTNNMNSGRWYPGSVALPGDKMFTMIGRPGGPYPEVWQEGQGWSLLTGANLNNGVLNYTGYQSTWLPILHLMPNGNIFHSGPTTQMNVINPNGNGSISSAGLSNNWYPKYSSAVMYDEGKILVAGGAANSTSTAPGSNRAMVIDLNGATPTKTNIASMNNTRKFGNGVALPNGEVIIVGGNSSGIEFSDSGSILEAEIWNPNTQTFRRVANMSVPRNYHSVALLMPDGRVWSAGGGLCNCNADHPNHQIYSPPYLFNANGSLATRPTITSAPNSTGYGATINVQASSNIQRFTMVKMSGVTHNLNSDQRFLNVNFSTVSNGSYQLNLHNNPNVLTPGYWMLFALNSQGVPSVSKVIQIQNFSGPTTPPTPVYGLKSFQKPATASSIEVPSFTPHMAVDNNTQTRWGSVQAVDPQWIQIDLGVPINIDRVELSWEAAFASSYQIQTSDNGTNWTTIYSTTTGNGGIDNLTGLNGTGRYVRMFGTRRGAPWGYSLWEFKVYGIEASTNQAPSITNPGNQSNAVGSAISQQISATDPDGDSLTFSATGLPAGLSINSSTGRIQGTVSTAGNYNVTVTANDGNGGTDSASFTWVVGPGLDLNPISTNPQQMGSQAVYTASFSGGQNPRFKWLFGDGSAETAYSNNATIGHTFSQPGRYLVTLTATDDTGRVVTERFAQLVFRPLTNQRPTVSMSIVYEERTGNDRVWNVNPDNNTVTVSDAVARQKLNEISVGNNPRALAIAPDGRVWVTNKDDATISIINSSNFQVVQTINMPRGSQPHGIVFAPNGSNGYVTLESTGTLVRLNPSNGSQTGSVNVGANPRHLSVLADSSRIYVSRFITPPVPGESTGNPQTGSGSGAVVVVNSNLNVAQTISLQFGTRADTEGNGRGLPNYLGPAVISPDGLAAWVPSKQDNIARGTLRENQNLDHDHTVRSIASFINLSNNQEQFVNRIDFDNGGVASSGQFGRYGAYLFVALEGSKEVAVVDAYANTELFRIDVGFAPQGVVVSADGQTLFVHNFLGRSVSVIDIRNLLNTNENNANTVSTIDTVANERLSGQVLRGKELFYDAKDTRLALDAYMSCASCHNAGDSDGRVWDLTGLGEGVRNTISLQGHADQGVLHWSGNFDEVHDFEEQIRNLAGGTGLMTDNAFNASRDPFGPAKAGRSADLDALAAYVNSLNAVPNSPFRQQNGSLTAAGEAGKQVFVAQGCASCHSGAEFTDSAQGLLHDIGTIKPDSGQRLNNALTGLDTPTLRGLWTTAPYLHDGSAPTLAEAVNAHNGINLSGSNMTNLVAFLNQIDEQEPAPAEPNVNNAPTLNNPGNQTGTVGNGLNLQLTATDPDGDNLTYGTSGLPNGLNLNSGNGSISGTPTTAGVSNVTITVNDGNGGNDSVSFSWTITDDSPPPPPPPTGGTGQITWEYWNTGWGTTLDTLRNDPNFPDNPTNSSTLTAFEAPVDRADIFGQQISGFLYPPVTGQYTFWIASDDEGELWLSSNNSEANAVEIASVPGWTFSREWTKYPSQQSATVTLQAGQAYFIKALSQDGAGGDNLAVAWQMPGGSRTVIAGQYLAPIDGGTNPPAGNNPPVLTNPGNQTHGVGDNVSLQLVATDADGDSLSFGSGGLPAGLNLNTNSGQITGSPTSATSLNVNITVNDGNGGTNSVSFLWTITDDAPPPPPPPTGGTGQITWEYWNTGWGTTLDTLRNDPNFPDNPTNSSTLTAFEAPVDRADIFGQQISGFLYPPVTGQYTFWIASDDEGELWLSSNNSEANAAEIASVPGWTFSREWTKYPSQQSATVTLQAGQAYFIKALSQDGAGGDNLAVAWQIPGGSRTIIAGQYLAPVEGGTNPPAGNNPPVLTNPGNQTHAVGDSVSLQLVATDADGDSLSFGSGGLPAGLNLNTNSGQITGSPTSATSLNVNITVNDGNGGTNSVSFLWTITDDAPPPPPPPTGGTGQITWEYWNTGWGTTLDTLRNDPNFPDNPTNSSTLTAFEAPVDRADIFGQQISGFLYPPVTGQYTFWIASDDEGELWLSSNNSEANAAEIASVPGWTFSREWTKYPSQQSATVTLQAGQAYFIKALSQDGAGGDNLAVAWQIPGGSRTIIAGQYLAPVEGGTNPPAGNNPPVLTNPGNQTHAVGDSVSLQLVATDADGDSLSFGSGGLPAGLNLNTNSGQITGVPTSATSLNVNVSVNDGNGGTNSVSFLWTITDDTPPPPPPPTGGTGQITWEYWNTGWGTTVDTLRNDPDFPNSPDNSDTLTTFEAPINRADVFGQRIRGYVYPPVTGQYTFWIASDDQGELWLSTNTSPNNAVQIATVSQWTLSRQWTKDPEQKSVTISLQAGQAYYIEALAQEGGGGDHLAIAWQIPGQSLAVIDGQYLSPIE